MDSRRLMTTVALACGLGVVLAGQTPVLPGGQPPVFSAQSELVVLQVIVEDYVHDEGNRFLCLLLLAFAAALGAGFALFAVLKIALGPVAAG